MKNTQTLGGGVLENNNKSTLKNSQGYNNSQNLKKYKTSENINQNKKDIQNQDILFTNNKDKIFYLKHQPNVNFVSTSITKWGRVLVFYSQYIITKWNRSFTLNSQSSILKSTYRQLAADTFCSCSRFNTSPTDMLPIACKQSSVRLCASLTKGGKSFNLNGQPPADFVSTPLTKGGRGDGIPQSHPTLTKGGRGDGVSESYPTLTKGDKKTSFKLSAFSLIELSIVLIIMGLLVAGVTGGQSLIQSAKLRSFVNEVSNYKQAVNTFYTINGRLPGDPNGTGRMGYSSGNSLDDYYDEHAPWEEINSDGMVDYKEGKTNSSYRGKESKYIKNVIYKFKYVDSYWVDGYLYDESLKNTNIMELDLRYLGYIPAYIVAGIEEKIDDRSLKTGNVAIDDNCFATIPKIESDNARIELEWGDGDIETYEELASAKNGICHSVIFKMEL